MRAMKGGDCALATSGEGRLRDGRSMLAVMSGDGL